MPRWVKQKGLYPEIRKWMGYFVIMLILSLSSVFLFDAALAQAVMLPNQLKIGVILDQNSLDFGTVQGAYLLQDSASGQIIVPSVSPGEGFRAQMQNGQIALSRTAGDQLGVFAGPIVMKRINSGAGTEKNPDLVQLAAKSYRGQLEIRLNTAQTGLHGIVELPLEEYLYAVVPREVSASWPGASLRAQAVIARTYAAKNTFKHLAEGYNLCATTNCQVFGDHSQEAGTSNQAVRETAGLVLTDQQGSLAETLYHSNSGGYTENNVHVFGADLSYLQGRSDPYSLGQPMGTWHYATVVSGKNSRGEAGLRELLLTSNPDLGTIQSITLIKYPSGRVKTVQIVDSKGKSLEISGASFAGLFNPNFAQVSETQVMSRFFELSTDATITIQQKDQQITQHGGVDNLPVVSAQGLSRGINPGGGDYAIIGGQEKVFRAKAPTTLEFEGHGWGHGVGLSQWGAFAMAQQGFTHPQILEFYYPGTILTQAKNE